LKRDSWNFPFHRVLKPRCIFKLGAGAGLVTFKVGWKETGSYGYRHCILAARSRIEDIILKRPSLLFNQKRNRDKKSPIRTKINLTRII
jgi:hypothetical protein